MYAFVLVVNVSSFYIVYVNGFAILDQFFDTGHNFNNVGPQPNSPAVVFLSNTDHESLHSLFFVKIVCNSFFWGGGELATVKLVQT